MDMIQTPENELQNRSRKLSFRKKIALGAAAVTTFGVGAVTIESMSSQGSTVECTREDPSTRSFMTQPLGKEVCEPHYTSENIDECRREDPSTRDYMTQPLGRADC